MQCKLLPERTLWGALWKALWVVSLVLLCTSGPAGAAPEHGRRFKDWAVRCEQPTDSGVKRCFIFQNLVLKETGKRLVHVAIGHLASNGRAAAVVTLPLGISLPPGATMSVDGGEPVHFPIERCDASGCTGALALSDPLVAAMKRGREARIGFQDGAHRRVAVPVSLLGFTAGFEYLDNP